MDTIELPFATIHTIAPNRAEVIVHQGVELDDADVDQYHECLRANLRAPFTVLVNKRYDYTYTFSAMQRVGCIPDCAAIAVVAPSVSAQITTELVSRVMGVDSDYVRVFHSRMQAMGWLDRCERRPAREFTVGRPGPACPD